MALEAFPEKSARDIATQVGCSHTYVNSLKPQVESSFNLPDRVIGKDGKSYPASRTVPGCHTPRRQQDA